MTTQKLQRFIAFVLLLSPSVVLTQTSPRVGVLLLAHGGAPEWNQRVTDVARSSDVERPTEVAFGMASRPAIQAAVDALAARGVTQIVAVPLFVSSHSSVVTSTEYLLGLRAEAPADLRLFAAMAHGAHGAASAAGAHGGHGADVADGARESSPSGEPAPDLTSPVVTRVPVHMTPALNRHSIVGEVLADRARTISSNPAHEAVILVAHGPVPDDDNEKWLADMAVLAAQVRRAAPYAAVDFLTVRDDAGSEIRERATADLRSRVSAQLAEGRRVLVVPHLLSFGGIEQGIRARLEGLAYTMAGQAIMPDPRVVTWVNASVSSAGAR